MGFINHLHTVSKRGSEVNIANTGLVNKLKTKTIGAETNVFNAGLIDKAKMYDSNDLTNVFNAGRINDLSLKTGHHGVFNVNNVLGSIGSLDAYITRSSELNLFT